MTIALVIIFVLLLPAACFGYIIKTNLDNKKTSKIAKDEYGHIKWKKLTGYEIISEDGLFLIAESSSEGVSSHTLYRLKYENGILSEKKVELTTYSSLLTGFSGLQRTMNQVMEDSRVK